MEIFTLPAVGLQNRNYFSFAGSFVKSLFATKKIFRQRRPDAVLAMGGFTSALPNKGLPLPFISYGGSNLLAMFTCVGLLFSVARHAPAREKRPATATVIDENPFAAKAT